LTKNINFILFQAKKASGSFVACSLDASNFSFALFMINFDFYKLTLLGLLLSFCAGTAYAQKGAEKVVFSADGSMNLASNTSNAEPAASTTLALNLPPAPETNAFFYDGTHKDLTHALAWMQETNAIVPTYWNLYTESRIRLQMRDYAGARTTAENAYKLALKHMPASQQYVTLSAAVVAKANELAQH
jgi:hypothetical protein